MDAARDLAPPAAPPEPLTLRALLADAADRLARSGVDSPRRTAEWIVEEVTGADRAALYRDAAAEPADAARVRELVARRAAGEPVQYVLGHADFFGLRLAVSPDVLIPRPETEELVEHALGLVAGIASPVVLDIGTGSGAIALAVKHARPDAVVVAADVSADALAVARANAAALGLEVGFVHADALAPSFADGVAPAVDLLVSNPPYVPAAERDALQREVRDHEPALALFVPDADPLRPYRALAGHAGRLLAPGGALAVETHADHGAAVAALFREAGLADVALHRDLAGRDRIVTARAS